MSKGEPPDATVHRAAWPGVLLAAEVLLLALGIWGLAEGSIWQTVTGWAGAFVAAAVVVVITVRRREQNGREVRVHLRLLCSLRPYLIGLCAVWGALMVLAAVRSSPWWLAGLVLPVALLLVTQAQVKKLSRLSRSTEAAVD
ncbi:hypothetical protein [Kineococcus sp. R86509]|uniref:hypothetical protein n=1 Tax=Kineococcus sp. R86509 TaxID=3093851 RepID=UPI0036D244E1